MPAAPTAPPPPPGPPAAPASAPPPGWVPAPSRPGAPPRVQLGVVLAGLVAALVLPGTTPGVGVLLLAVVVATVVTLVRAPGGPRQLGQLGQHRSRWQWVHGTAAVLLAASAAVRDAGWLVPLDLLAALLLGTLALAPARGWLGVLGAPLRPLPRIGTAVGWLLRGLRVATRSTLGRFAPRRPVTGAASGTRWPWLVPALRGTALTVVLLAVFVPLLSSADARFAGLFGDALRWFDDVLAGLGRWLGLTRVDVVVARVVVFVVGATAMGAALVVAWDARGGTPPAEGAAAPRPRPVLTRRVEWLLPLGALDALFAVFLLVRVTATDDPSATYAEQVHAGFAQLVVATALVLGVVALAVRWTPMTAGPRSALAVLCVLSLGLDAAAVLDLHAYVEAYGLTELRIGVAAICAGLAGLLVLLLVAGALSRGQTREQGQRPAQPWVPHLAVVVAASCLVGLTASDPDAMIARSQLSRLDGGTTTAIGPDLPYLQSLSADAAPPLAEALRVDPDVLGPDGACLLADVAGTRDASRATGWASANLSRARAADLVASLPACT